MYRLINPWRDYDWGSVRALPDFLRRPATGEPVAEIWMGTHELAPSHVETDDGIRLLSSVTGALPFMVKLLAAERPLSIQVHPSRAQAERGFAAEEASGIPADAATRNYKDPHAKAEMVYALSSFDTLVGFRPTAEILRLFTVIDTRLSRELGDRLAADPGFSGIVRLVSFVLTDACIGADDIDELLTRCRELLAVGLDVKRAFMTAVEVAEHHPHDRGLIVTLLLNRLTLQPGEAAFLEPGIIHAHLRGLCVEVMESSDNVLRAGLTSKHVDVAEMIETLHEGMARLARVTPEVRESGTEVFTGGTDRFALSVTQCAGPAGYEVGLEPGGDRIVTCLGGDAVVVNAAGRELELGRGDSLFAGAADGPLSLRGTCEVAVAHRPDADAAEPRLVDLV